MVIIHIIFILFFTKFINVKKLTVLLQPTHEVVGVGDELFRVKGLVFQFCLDNHAVGDEQGEPCQVVGGDPLNALRNFFRNGLLKFLIQFKDSSAEFFVAAACTAD